MILDFSKSPFSVTNYRWGEMLLLIGGIAILIIALLLFVDYLTNRKKAHLLWSVSFLGIWSVIYTILQYPNTTSVGGGPSAMTVQNFIGDYSYLIWLDFGSVQYAIISTLLLITPGLMAAGLLYETMDDKKFGDICLIFMGLMTAVSIVFLVDPSNEVIEWIPGVAQLCVQILTYPMYAVIILIPILKNREQLEGILISIGGVLMLVVRIMITFIALGTGPMWGQNEIVDLWFAAYPFIILVAVLCYAFGVLIPPKWNFKIPNVEFEEDRQAPA